MKNKNKKYQHDYDASYLKDINIIASGFIFRISGNNINYISPSFSLNFHYQNRSIYYVNKVVRHVM